MIPSRHVTGEYGSEGAPCSVWERGAFRFCHAEGSQANLRLRPPAFHHVSCYRRLPLLRSARARHAFVKALAEVRREYEFKLVGYVVMPEHVHLLISEPRRGNPSTILKMLKQRVSRRLRSQPRRRVPATQGVFAFAIAWDVSAIVATALLWFQRLEPEEQD